MNNTSYYYLNRILDITYKVHYKYNIPFKKCINVFRSDTGNQIEIRGTCYYKLEDRIEINKKYLSELWKQRNEIGIKQLKLW